MGQVSKGKRTHICRLGQSAGETNRSPRKLLRVSLAFRTPLRNSVSNDERRADHGSNFSGLNTCFGTIHAHR